MAHSYDVGTRVWQPDPSEGWIASEVQSKTIEGDKVKLVFQLANGEVSVSPTHEWHIWTWLTQINSVKTNPNYPGRISG